MQARSAAFDRAVRLGGRGVCQVDAYFGGQITVEALPVVEGSIGLSLTAAARRTLTLKVADVDRSLGRSPDGPLTPWGNELRVRTGFEVASSWGAPVAPELLEQGWFRVVHARRTLSGDLALTAIDRSVAVASALFEAPWVIAAGADRAAQVAAIIRSRLPGAVVDPAPPMAAVPATVVYEEGTRSGDPWRNATDLCASDGKDLFWTPQGSARIGYRPDPQAAPVWSYRAEVGGGLLDAEDDLDLTPVRNVWYVQSQAASSSAGAYVSSEITDPASPIHPGRVGRRPEWYTDPLALTQAQLQAQADYYRLTQGGRAEGLTPTARPHPAMEPGDVVNVYSAAHDLNVTAVAAEWDLDLFASRPATIRTLGRIVR